MLYYCVNKEECIACGICQLKAPDLFQYDDEGLSYPTLPIDQPLPEAVHFRFKEAYVNCPTGAIKRADSPFIA